MTILFLLMMLSGAYILYFGLIARPDHSVYAFVVFWFISPFFIRMVPLLQAVQFPPFSLVQITCASAILLAVVTRGKSFARISAPRSLKLFYVLAVATVGFSTILSFVAWRYIEMPPTGSALLSRVPVIVSLFSSLVFLYGAMAFITRLRQVEVLLAILILFGIELALEALLFKYLGWLPAYHGRAIHETGRFMSITLGDYQFVGMFLMVASSAVLYFVFARKAYIFALLIPFWLFIALGINQSDVIGSAAVGLASFLFLIAPGRVRRYSIALVALVIVSIVVYRFGSLAEPIPENLRIDFWNIQGFFSRWGIIARGVDVIIYSFGLGVGPGMLRHFMNAPFVPESGFVDILPNVPAIRSSYDGMLSGTHITGAHNVIIELVGEHGILGAVLLISLVGLILRNFFLTSKIGSSDDPERRRIAVARASIFSMLLSIGVFLMFNHDLTPLFLYLTLFYITFLLRPRLLPARHGGRQRSRPQSRVEDHLPARSANTV